MFSTDFIFRQHFIFFRKFLLIRSCEYDCLIILFILLYRFNFIFITAAPTACTTDCTDGSGGTACCTSSNKCGVGEGDCDMDADCIGSLKCGVDNCDTSLGFPGNYDCCFNPSCADGSGGTACCTSSNKCGVGEGDCDLDADCIGNLRCGIDNCDTSLGFPSNYDCCYIA